MTIETINPATEKIIKIYQEMSEQNVSDIIDITHKAYLSWKHSPFLKRSDCLRKLANLLKDQIESFALLISTEMGKPITQAKAELEKCALLCNYYADHGEEFLQSKIIATDMQKSYVAYQPLGIVFGIMPWNFPFWQVFRFAIPNIMAGNGILLKHAPISTGAALAIEQLFEAAGFIKNLFRSLILSNEQAGKVIRHPLVSAVTLTGSPAAGKMVAAEAAKSIKKSVLELGGNDPYLILADANLENAAEACVTSRMTNAGQVCIAAKRLIVLESIHQPFLELILEKIKKYKFGDPSATETNFGPLARKDLRDKVHSQVTASIEKGAELTAGGILPEIQGFYYPPTILNNISKRTPAYAEEIFGPVISVIPVKDEDEAVYVANDSIYGLGGGIFTRDIAHGEALAEMLQVGSCTINGFVASDPRLPFGGIKNSGYGRELAIEGLHSFVNIKTISIK